MVTEQVHIRGMALCHGRATGSRFQHGSQFQALRHGLSNSPGWSICSASGAGPQGDERPFNCSAFLEFIARPSREPWPVFQLLSFAASGTLLYIRSILNIRPLPPSVPGWGGGARSGTFGGALLLSGSGAQLTVVPLLKDC